jgi:hypothetical protein
MAPSDQAAFAEAVETLRRVFAGIDREVAIADPETGAVLAYLVPPAIAHARWAAWSREQPGSDRPAVTLDEFRELTGRVEPSVTIPG